MMSDHHVAMHLPCWQTFPSRVMLPWRQKLSYPLLVIGSDLSSEIQPVWQRRLLCLSLHNVGNTAVGDTVKLTCHANRGNVVNSHKVLRYSNSNNKPI